MSDDQSGIAKANNSKRCIECYSKIDSEARICVVCKSHQTRWRNNIKWVAGITGLISVVVSAVTYAASSFEPIRKTLFPKCGINIIDLNSRKYVAIQNIGDQRVFVGGIEFEFHTENLDSADEISLSVNINAGDTAVIQLNREFSPNEMRVVATREAEGAIKEVLHSAGGAADRCLGAMFLSSNNSVFKMVSRYLDGDLLAYDAAANVTFFAEGDPTPKSANAPARVIFNIPRMDQAACPLPIPARGGYKFIPAK